MEYEITTLSTTDGHSFFFINWLKDTNLIKAYAIDVLENGERIDAPINYNEKVEFRADMYNYFMSEVKQDIFDKIDELNLILPDSYYEPDYE